MKKLLGIFMLAVVATVGFAFTSPEPLFTDTFLYWSGTAWVPGTGPNCTGHAEACAIRFSTPVHPSQYQLIGSQAGAELNPDQYTATNIDDDNDGNGAGSTPKISVLVTVTKRFPIAP